MAIKYPEPKPQWFTCETCGERVFEIERLSCGYCRMISYLNFRHLVNWPLDEADKLRLGLS